MSFTPGSKLGPYEIQSFVGAGGMGEVYRARDTRLQRIVAIKILPQSLSSDPDRLGRFQQEARIVGALNHPNLMAIYDVGSQDGVHFLVSEFLDGQTLRERLKAGSLPQRRVNEYSLQIAKGLAAAHEQGIVHRDLKPDNIFILPDERVKVLDFGLAKQVVNKATVRIKRSPMSTERLWARCWAQRAICLLSRCEVSRSTIVPISSVSELCSTRWCRGTARSTAARESRS